MFRKITAFALFIALAIMALSAYTRLSDSVGRCTKWVGWPGCYTESTLLGKLDVNVIIEQFSALANQVPNSYLLLLGSFCVLALLLLIGAFVKRPGRLVRIGALSVLVLLAVTQFGLGVWAEKIRVMPLVLTGQLFVGIISFWLLFWVYIRSAPVDSTLERAGFSGFRLLTQFAMLILLLQTVLGFWVSSNLAGMVCADFPKCNGQWMPDNADYWRGLNLFAAIETGYTGILSFDGLLAIQWVHRVGAAVCFILLTTVMLMATSETRSNATRKSGVLLSLLLLVQILLGIASVNSELAAAIVIAHNLFAVILMLPLIAMSYYQRYRFDSDVEELVADGTVVPVFEGDVKEEYVDQSNKPLYLRLKSQLKKTRAGLGGVLAAIPLGQKEINSDLLEEIEASLLMADIGVDATSEIVSQLTEQLDRKQLKDGEALLAALKQILLDILKPSDYPLVIPAEHQGPFVILVVGINGVGKTTTIGKLAKRLQLQGHSVMLAAGDTFRAAAVEQLETWGERNNIHVVAQHTGADSASVIYDGVQSAQSKGIDVLIADTAGRLHTKSNLMEELKKIKRIMGKIDDSAPHEVLLVLDAGTGQNALSQTKIFNETVALSGLALTKLDGTAKGGVIFGLAKQFGLPIRFIGVGEGIDDLQDFNAKAFVDALFVKD